MDKKKVSCVTWTVVFLALAGASGWFVYRRIPLPQAALIGGFTGGLILVLAISSIIGIGTRILEWWFLIRTQFGDEPADPDAPVHRVNAERHALEELSLRTGTSYGLRAAGRIVTAAFAAVIFNAIAIVVIAVFCALFPPHADELHWWEVDVERFIDQRVRTPLVAAGVVSTPGFRRQELCEGCAHGRLEIDGRAIELKHATYRGGRAVHLSATPDDDNGVTLDGDRIMLTYNGKPFEVPRAWLQPNDIETSLREDGDYAGRVTIVAPGDSVRCRVSFHTRIDPERRRPGG